MSGARKALAAAVIFSFASVVSANAAGIIKIDESAFIAGSGKITFSEPGTAVGDVNPVYSPSLYGGGANSPTVSFAGYFTGQSLGAGCGGAPTGCVVGTPTGPLSLDFGSPATRIVTDGAAPDSPVLSGSPTFNGPVAILFSELQAGVGLSGGFFNAIGGTAITAFGADGTVLGQVVNEELGIEFLGLVMSDESASIAGLLFSLVGPEPAGFGVDNIRFGIAGQIVVPGGETPLPGAVLLFGSVLAGGIGMMRRRKLATAAA